MPVCALCSGQQIAEVRALKQFQPCTVYSLSHDSTQCLCTSCPISWPNSSAPHMTLKVFSKADNEIMHLQWVLMRLSVGLFITQLRSAYDSSKWKNKPVKGKSTVLEACKILRPGASWKESPESPSESPQRELSCCPTTSWWSSCSWLTELSSHSVPQWGPATDLYGANAGENTKAEETKSWDKCWCCKGATLACSGTELGIRYDQRDLLPCGCLQFQENTL